MKKSTCMITLMIPIFFFTSMVFADSGEWKIDTAHSNVYFDITHTFATVRGQFDEISGTLFFDPENGMVTRWDMDVKAASINTNNQQRDNHLRSKDFFQASDYPLLRFRSQRIERVKDNQFTIHGALTVKDVTRDVAIPFEFLGVKDNPLDPKTRVAGFQANFTIDRLAYHVGSGQFYKMGAIGKDVTVVVSIEALKKK